MKHSLREYEAEALRLPRSTRCARVKRSAMLLFRVAKPRFIREALLHELLRNSLHARQRASFPNKRALLSQCSFVWLELTKKMPIIVFQ
jgi:hypothetical protein